ncbi:MAG: Uma2 family endonuclease [Ignavibacteria bacterium]
MQTQKNKYITPEEYLEIERKAEFKSEYYNGEMFALAGAGRQHNIININIGSSLNNQLKDKPCEVYVNDMRVFIDELKFYTYPDVVVVCGEPEFKSNENPDTLINPVIIIEILSKSTEKYDKGTKFNFYRRISSLREYILVYQDEFLVEQFIKITENEWKLKIYNKPNMTVLLESIDCHLPVQDVYHKAEAKIK